jgi:hypothetical protein
MEETVNPNVVPRGPGGILGHIFRMIVMLCTGGIIYPNTFVEGMDLTAIQAKTQGKLYENQKGSTKGTRF